MMQRLSNRYIQASAPIKTFVAVSTRYFALSDSSYNQSIRFRDDGENEVTAAARPRT